MGHRFRCVWHGNPMHGHEFDSDNGVCPKCGRSGLPHVQELVSVHFMMPHPHGPFMGPDGIRRAIGCEQQRDVLAYSQLAEHHYAATDDPRAVTCPSCRGLPVFRQMLAAITLSEQPRPFLAEAGCCG